MLNIMKLPVRDYEKVSLHFEVNIMSKTIILLSVLMFSITLIGCDNSNASELNMASAEATMQSYYEALKSNEYDDFKRLHLDDGFIISKLEFNELSGQFRDYTIIQNKKMIGDVPDPTRRFIQVKEFYGAGQSQSLMNYLLIKEGQLWKIESYNADEGILESDEIIEKQIKDMFQ